MDVKGEGLGGGGEVTGVILIPSCQEIEITRRGTLALEEEWLWVAQTTGDATG